MESTGWRVKDGEWARKVAAGEAETIVIECERGPNAKRFVVIQADKRLITHEPSGGMMVRIEVKYHDMSIGGRDA